MFVSISPDGTFNGGGSIHSIANPMMFDRVVNSMYEAWASHNATLEHEFKMTGRMLALGCDRRPKGGQSVVHSDVAKLRHLLQCLLCHISAALTPSLQEASADTIVAKLRQAGEAQRLICASEFAHHAPLQTTRK
jgi:hypothetical protein